jgi:hypothetical protein
MGTGGGKGSSNTQAVLTPEQRQTIALQNDALKNVFMPAYTKTIGGAGQVLNQVAPAVNQTAQTAMDVGQQTGALQQRTGSQNLTTGSEGLKALFDPQYEQNQIQGALQAGREATREQLAGQNAMYGGAGGLGSSRQALADTNLRQLGEQRQATAAADAQAKVQANRANAAQALMGGGQSQLAAANQAAASRIGYAQSPQDMYAKYANVIFGVPQGSTTPNYAGTQGQTGSSKGFKVG